MHKPSSLEVVVGVSLNRTLNEKINKSPDQYV